MASKKLRKRGLALLMAAALAAPTALAGAGPAAAAEKADEGSTLSYLLQNLAQYQEAGGSGLVPSTTREPVTGVPPCMPADGDVDTVVAIVEFQDKKFDPDFVNKLKDRMFRDQSESDAEDVAYPKDSLRAYYQRASFGKLNIDGEFIEFNSEHDRDWYKPVGGNMDSVYQDVLDYWAEQIIKDRPDTQESDLEYLNNYLSQFDKDGDLEIDGCYFCCAGGNTGWSSPWWAYRTDETTVTLGDYHFNKIIQMVDTLHQESGLDDLNTYIETFIHETGHQLGLDDYYSYDSSLDKLDSFAMMNNNTGEQDGFAKMLLGWIPKESVQFVTEDATVELRPYAKNGDIAIILPKEEYEKYGIYSQFILAEYYKDEGNDHIRDLDVDWGVPTNIPDGIRFYHVYARLHVDQFIGSNRSDQLIPLISAYRNPADEYAGFYHPGDELAELTDPSTAFYVDARGEGLMTDTTLEDTGISITNITAPSENGTMSFQVHIADQVAGPKIVSAEVVTSYGDPCVKVTFDQPVNPVGSGARIYDLDPETGSYNSFEPWGDKCVIKKTMDGTYSKEANVVYIVPEAGAFRYTTGVLVIPAGTVMSSQGVGCPAQTVEVSSDLSGLSKLKVSVPGGTYDSPQTISITGAPAGVPIYYTLDGTEPNMDSYTYDGPIQLDRGATLKAMAFYPDGYAASERIREVYTLHSLSLDRKEVTLDVNETFMLKYKHMWDGNNDPVTPEFKSSDPTTVYVDSNGMVLARKEGIAEITATFGGLESACKVTVKAGVADPVEKALQDAYGKSADTQKRVLSEVLNGSLTLQEFGAQGYLSKTWIGAIDDFTYRGEAITPEVYVYDGVKALGAEDVEVSYANNIDAGTARVTATLLGERKGKPDVTAEFTINPAVLGANVYFYNIGVKCDGKAHKPLPLLVMWDSGVVRKTGAKELKIVYRDSNWNIVKALKNEGHYYAEVYSNSKNYVGDTALNVFVQKKNLVEKLKVKKLTKSFSVEDAPIEPAYGLDYKIKVPKSYAKPAEEGGTLVDQDLRVEYYHNEEPGKMTMVLTANEGSPYVGSTAVTFRIK